MIYRQRFVLDTSAFTNATTPHDNKAVNKHTKELVAMVAEARMKLNISCYLPFPTVHDELISSLKRRDCPEKTLVQLDTWFVKKTPNRYEVKIPSEIFYEYISDIRTRMNKGLRVAEDAVRQAFKGKNEKDEKVIRMLRDKYKVALRQGILDSREDLDVLLLAKELDAGVVTADEGMQKWAERLGLRIVEAKVFPKMLKEYLNSYSKGKI